MPAFSPFDSVVRITTGHVISSASMASRAYLKDTWRAVIVRASDGGLWVASTSDALNPDDGALIRRGEEAGGPPARYARASLVKITIAWGGMPGRAEPEGEAHIANPRVVKSPGGAAIAVASIAKARGLTGAIAEGRGPTPIDLPTAVDLSLEDVAAEDGEVSVATLFLDDGDVYWPVRRRTRIGSEPDVDFLGQRGAVALDLALQPSDAGSAVFSDMTSDGTFLGLVRPVGTNTSMLLSVRLIAETLA